LGANSFCAEPKAKDREYCTKSHIDQDHFQIARSTYYYEHQAPTDESDLEEAIQTAYDENRRVYGQQN